tara:strand:- start:44 stop:247 length:204 start_codon:yes stop_codon:yes gene_type:complete
VKVGDLVRDNRTGFQEWVGVVVKTKISSTTSRTLVDVLFNGKIHSCAIDNLEVINENENENGNEKRK